MIEGHPLFEALQQGSLERFVEGFTRLGKGAASRHALRIDSTRYAALQVLPNDYGLSSLSLVGFSAGLLLSDRLSGPLAPFTRHSSSVLASAQALWCLRGSRPYRTELPELLFVGDLPQDVYALSHALFVLVKENDAIQAAEVVDRLLDRGIDRDRLVELLSKVATECSTDYRPALLLSSALQLSARLGGDEVGNLLRGAVRGTIAVQLKPPPGTLPPRATLPPALDEELPTLLASQVNASGVVDLRRVRAQVRDGGADAAWQAILGALRAKASWQALVDMLSLVTAERLMTALPSRLEDQLGLHQVLEAMAQVRAVRWLMSHHPCPGALKALIQLASYVGWLKFTVGNPDPVTPTTEQSSTRLLATLRDALKHGDRLAAVSAVARYRELNLPRESLAGVLAEEGVRGGESPQSSALRLVVTETALSEAEALYGSMEEGSYFQGLARVLTLIPPDSRLMDALEGRTGVVL